MMLKRLCILLPCLFALAEGWKQCSEEGGGGQCPDMATCCSTEIPGVSACITSKSHDPDGQGACCGSNTGCGYGYECAVEDSKDGEPYCKLKDDHPGYDIPRYELCTVPKEMQEFYGFPIETVSGTYRLAYYSNLGDIMSGGRDKLHTENIFIMIHGSRRNADDYFCAALSIAPPNTLVIVPKFFAPEDETVFENQLVWAEKPDHDHPMSHSWRYGADALNAPISSYETIDRIIEFIAGSITYDTLQHISVVGHSAGGQVAHRWALLSNSPAWDALVDIRAIVANPRSFCYLDGRRIDGDEFDVPSQDDTAQCPGYDQWQWGLEPGGSISCRYKDNAVADYPQLRERYAKRNVIYLSGEYDTEEQRDRCETDVFQGKNRRERSENYFRSLEHYFGNQVHERHVISKSPHDHFLMLQNDIARSSIFGSKAIDDTVALEDDC